MTDITTNPGGILPVSTIGLPEILNDLAKTIYEDNKAKGFYERQHDFGRSIALIHSELSEALEADRDECDGAVAVYDKHLPNRYAKEVELADALIRILDTAAVEGMDIGGAVVEKLEYNRTRPHKHGKAY